jgi:hypothetical protein
MNVDRRPFVAPIFASRKNSSLRKCFHISAPLRRNDGNGGKAMKPRTGQILNQEISLDRDPHGRVGLMPPSKSWEKREISL